MPLLAFPPGMLPLVQETLLPEVAEKGDFAAYFTVAIHIAQQLTHVPPPPALQLLIGDHLRGGSMQE